MTWLSKDALSKVEDRKVAHVFYTPDAILIIQPTVPKHKP